jgi:hypothetical protein
VTASSRCFTDYVSATRLFNDMLEPAETKVARYLESRLAPALAWWNAFLHAGAGCRPLTDACVRTAACVAVAVAGFWYPLWCEHKWPGPDSRMGIVPCFAWPVIAFLAVRASRSIYRAFGKQGWKSIGVPVTLAIALALFCWLPVAFVTIQVVVGFSVAFFRLHAGSNGQ